METITLTVDNKIAKAYREYSPHKQQEIQNIVNNFLKIIIEEKTLEQIIEEMQTQCQNNGLTQEILDEILNHG